MWVWRVRTCGRGTRLAADYLKEAAVPNWAEQVTAIATAVSAIGLIGAIGAVVFAARQAREARIGRQAATAVEFFAAGTRPRWWRPAA
jgi:hypothetical protein